MEISVSRREIRIPMTEAGTAGLQGELFLPSTHDKHPLVLMTHAMFDGEERKIGPGTLQPQALWFARRGWAVAVVLRRGFGDSGGKFNRPRVGCGEAHLETEGAEDARDLSAAYEYLARFPEVDASRMIAVGDAMGGVSVVSFGVKAPPALKAVIGFSIYWPAALFSDCKKPGFVPFGDLGTEVPVPMLWIYAKNEHFPFPGPKSAAQFHQAFIAAGGNAEFSLVDRSGENGYFLFRDSPQLWGPVVERYLAARGLPSNPLCPDPAAATAKLPPGFSDSAQKAFADYQARGPFKAFAVGPGGSWGYSTGKRTAKLADEDALGLCGPTCKIITRDGQ
jgi:dienelactone hydrolase